MTVFLPPYLGGSTPGLYETDLDHFALLRLKGYLTGKLYRPRWCELGRNVPLCYRNVVEKLLAEACKKGW